MSRSGMTIAEQERLASNSAELIGVAEHGGTYDIYFHARRYP